MSKIVIKNTRIITMHAQQPPVFEGDLLIEGGIIKSINERSAVLDPPPGAEVIDGSNLLIMPGLINAHGHAAMSLLRGFADDMPLHDWLEKKIWPLESRLTGDDIYWGSLLSMAEMIRSGTTTFVDMYFQPGRTAEAAARCGIRAVLSGAMINLGNQLERSIAEAEELIQNWQGAENGRISIIYGPHAIYTVSRRFLEKVAHLAVTKGVPVQIHLSETRQEVDNCLAEHGLTPPQLLQETGLLEARVIAAHCIYLDDGDIDILAANGTGVVHNPGSNLKLGSGMAPVARLLARGVAVALGTDGAASNNNLDMFEEIRLAALLEKGVNHDPTIMAAEDVLAMATRGGAVVLGLDRVGQIREGWKADLIGIRLDRPHLTPLHNALANTVYSAGGSDVDLVLVDGQILLSGGRLTTIDEEEVRSEAARRAYDLVNTSPGKEASA